MKRSLLAGAAGFLILVAIGCRGSESPAHQAMTSEGTPPPAETATGGRSSAQPFAFTEADLEGYKKGLAKEIELVKAAQARSMEAKTPEERGAAEQAKWESSTIPEGAKASGLPEARYRETREAVNEVFKTLDFQGKIEGPLSIDLSRVSPEMREQISKDPFASLPPSSAAALRSRMGELVPLWSEYMTLTAVAG